MESVVIQKWMKNIIKSKIYIPGVEAFLKFQNASIARIAWPYSVEKDSLYKWRAFILFSIIIAGLIFGFFAFIPAIPFILNTNSWDIALTDLSGFILGFIFLFTQRIKFEIIAATGLLYFFVLGTIIICSVGFFSEGPIWLFTFSVLAGVLIGNWAALAAILMNTVCLSTLAFLMATGKAGNGLPFFVSTQSMIIAGANFFMLNTVTAVSVSTLVKGLSQSHKKKVDLADSLEAERKQLIKAMNSLESEIKDRIKAEQELKEAQHLFQLIAENTSALIAINDSNGDYIFVSPSHERLGYKPEELVGKSSFTLMEEEDVEVLFNHLIRAKNGEITKAFLNFRIKDSQGKSHPFRGTFDAIFKADGSLERIICIAEDLSDLKKAQIEKIDAILEAEETKRLALVGQVAGKMAHDFNNLLGIIMGVSEISLLECEDKDAKENFQLIFDQTIKGKNLTKNLVAFAKSQEPKQAFFKISGTIDNILNLIKNDLENTEIVVYHEPEIPDLLADEEMIEHALINLLQNSIHATSRTEQPRIKIRTGYHDHNITIEIEDNGCGIPAEHIEKIYDPSFTLKGIRDVSSSYNPDIKGTGYGMANVKKYIEQHKGNIKVESIVNTGTKFTITLPVIKKELSFEEKTEIQEQKPCVKKYILLVEDEQAIADIQYKVLTSDPCNHKVDTADTGQKAIDLFSRKQYDFISLDYVLPGSINGMDVYHHIRKTHKTLPVLFISGNIEFLESIKVLKEKDPFIDHLSKPCKNLDYLNGINRLMDKKINSRPAALL